MGFLFIQDLHALHNIVHIVCIMFHLADIIIPIVPQVSYMAHGPLVNIFLFFNNFRIQYLKMGREWIFITGRTNLRRSIGETSKGVYTSVSKHIKRQHNSIILCEIKIHVAMVTDDRRKCGTEQHDAVDGCCTRGQTRSRYSPRLTLSNSMVDLFETLILVVYWFCFVF